MNTLCPKMGVQQWTCSYEECNCHCKENIKKVKNMNDVNVNEVVAEDAAAAGAALNKLADDLKSKEATGETPVTASEG